MWLLWAFCSAWNMALPIGVCSWYRWVSRLHWGKVSSLTLVMEKNPMITSWYGEYPIIYKVLATSQVVSAGISEASTVGYVFFGRGATVFVLSKCVVCVCCNFGRCFFFKVRALVWHIHTIEVRLNLYWCRLVVVWWLCRLELVGTW